MGHDRHLMIAMQRSTADHPVGEEPAPISILIAVPATVAALALQTTHAIIPSFTTNRTLDI